MISLFISWLLRLPPRSEPNQMHPYLPLLARAFPVAVPYSMHVSKHFSPKKHLRFVFCTGLFMAIAPLLLCSLSSCAPFPHVRPCLERLAATRYFGGGPESALEGGRRGHLCVLSGILQGGRQPAQKVAGETRERDRDRGQGGWCRASLDAAKERMNAFAPFASRPFMFV